MSRKIKPGDQIGKLTVDSDSGERKWGYIVWLCRCECGRVIKLDTRTLQRENVRSCGCKLLLKPGRRDITGQKFGKLIAIEPTGMRGRNKEMIWHCHCDCGNDAYVSIAMLKSGYKKSCGCMKRLSAGDLSCRQFGNLTVLARDQDRNDLRYWRCSCRCGNESVVRESYLLAGRTRSCGCLQRKSLTNVMKFVDGTSVRKLENTGNHLNIRNTSGYNGVYFHRKNQKWIAQITFKSQTLYLGSYTNINEAATARKKAEESIYGSFWEEYYEQNRR